MRGSAQSACTRCACAGRLDALSRESLRATGHGYGLVMPNPLQTLTKVAGYGFQQGSKIVGGAVQTVQGLIGGGGDDSPSQQEQKPSRAEEQRQRQQRAASQRRASK